MIITKVSVEKLKLDLIKPFKIALGEIKTVENGIVKIETDEGLIGYGEAAHYQPVTGESLETVLLFLNKFAKILVGVDATNIAHIHELMDFEVIGNSSAKAAIDMALYDLLGKKSRMPLYQLLGGYKKSVQTDMTIGMGTLLEMVSEAKSRVSEGYLILKIKCGINVEEDIQVLTAIREAVGDSIQIKVDANQGFDKHTAIYFMEKVKNLNIYAIEQPVPYWNISDMAYLTNLSKIKIMADESVHDHLNAAKIVQNQSADIINIKLMKSAGIYKAQKITAVAESFGIPCMIGCMTESRLAIACGAHFAAANARNVKHVDLDSYAYFTNSDQITGGFTANGGTLTLTEKPGIGVDVNF